jgi:hypothetical protein
MKIQIGLLSVEEVYSYAIQIPSLRLGVLASGFPSRSIDDPKISDVDIALFSDPENDWETILKEYSVIIKRESELYAMASFNMLGRTINVYITRDREKYMRAQLQRQHEIMLANIHPHAIASIQEMKKNGFNTETAWCSWLEVSADDPHKWMMKWDCSEK